MMKRILCGLLCLLALTALTLPALAADSKAYTITVSGRAVDTSGLPCAAYRQGDVTMVPLRAIAEALGYDVEWVSKTREITVDDSIQQAVLKSGSSAAHFNGKLQVINLSRDEELSSPAVILQGHTYVPLEFFQNFFNDTAVSGTAITVSPSVCYLDDAVNSAA